jgi:predicted MFS family arabinose efflux permease
MAVTTAQDRNHAFSMRIALTPLAGFAGSVVGGLLPGFFARIVDVPVSAPAPYRLSLVAAAACLTPVVPILIASRRALDAATNPVEGEQATVGQGAGPGEDVRGRASQVPGPPLWEQVLPVGTVALLCAISFLRVMGEAVPRIFFNVYLDAELRMPADQIGALVGAGRLLAVPASLLMPVLASRWGNGRTVVLGALGVAVSLLPVSLIPHWSAAGLGYMSLTALAAIARSAFIVFCMESVAPRWQGTVSALTTMAASVSRTTTSLGAGFAVDLVGYRGTFLAGAGVTAAGAALFWSSFCRTGCAGGGPEESAPGGT